jgi:hypothetical protein
MEKRSSYSAGFNLKVIDYAEKPGNWAAGLDFSVPEFMCDIGVNRNLH